jgi:hypothetical protein
MNVVWEKPGPSSLVPLKDVLVITKTPQVNPDSYPTLKKLHVNSTNDHDTQSLLRDLMRLDRDHPELNVFNFKADNGKPVAYGSSEFQGPQARKTFRNEQRMF